MNEFEITPQGDGEYSARLPGHDGDTSLTVVLLEVEDASEGRMADDEKTAGALIAFLLEHQEASDLPPRIEFADVVVAYPESLDWMAALRS